jgi:hypothetical protein
MLLRPVCVASKHCTPGTILHTSMSWRAKHTCSGATAVQLARCLVTTCFRTTAPQSLALVRHVAPARICSKIKKKVVIIQLEDKDQHLAAPICMLACNDMHWHSSDSIAWASQGAAHRNASAIDATRTELFLQGHPCHLLHEDRHALSPLTASAMAQHKLARSHHSSSSSTLMNVRD